jgi:hypothetical protein
MIDPLIPITIVYRCRFTFTKAKPNLTMFYAIERISTSPTPFSIGQLGAGSAEERL